MNGGSPFTSIIRGTGLGFFLGLIPGTNSAVASFMSYAIERKVSKHPEKFGTGIIEGVAAPETANNAYANAALIPLFTLGLPGSPTIAILMGALIMNGLTPGPLLFSQHAAFVWAVIASLYIGNVILLILNLPLVGWWAKLLKIPYNILMVFILVFCIIGAYSLNNSIFDVGMMILCGLLGYLFKKLDFPLAPAILTLILGPLMERSLRESLSISQGDFSIFFTRPISLFFLIMAGDHHDHLRLAGVAVDRPGGEQGRAGLNGRPSRSYQYSWYKQASRFRTCFRVHAPTPGSW